MTMLLKHSKLTRPSKNYRKPILQRYVVRILLMCVTFTCVYMSFSHMQGTNLRSVIMGQLSLYHSLFLC